MPEPEIIGSGDDINDVMEMLAEDEPITEPVEEVKEEDSTDTTEEESTEDTESDELEIEDDEEKEEEIELDEEEPDLDLPVTRKEILKAFPDIFKKFPALQTSYYRDREFVDIIGTVDDAKIAVGKAKTLDNIQTKLLEGDTSQILEDVKKQDPEAFNRIADSYLDTLGKIDRNAYNHVAGNFIKNVITVMTQEGNRLGSDPLKEAAVVLNQFVLGTSEPQAVTKLAAKEDTSREDKLKAREAKFLQDRFESVRDDLVEKMDNSIKATITNKIDPKGVMTDFIKRHAIKEVMDDLEATIANDDKFKDIIKGLWERAAEDNFSTSSVNRIRKAYRSKAATLLPSKIVKSRNAALKGIGKRESKDRKGPVVNRKASSSSNGDKMAPGESVFDYLSRD